jgi:hypothetical protein
MAGSDQTDRTGTVRGQVPDSQRSGLFLTDRAYASLCQRLIIVYNDRLSGRMTFGLAPALFVNSA